MSEEFRRLALAIGQVCSGQQTNHIVSAQLAIMVQVITDLPEVDYRNAIILHAIKHLAAIIHQVA